MASSYGGEGAGGAARHTSARHHHHHHHAGTAADRLKRVDPADLQRLKARDNHTNVRHLVHVWAVIAVSIGAAIAFEQWLAASGHSPWWLAPVALLVVVAVGASQHQLGGAIHEGTHYMLFRDRKLNELVSDWVCAFPIYTTTYQFRVHHLAHHQFVNDPQRDPDWSQLRESNHWLDFPIEHIDLVKKLLSQLWLPNLIRYTIVRAKYSALGFDANPYRDEARGKSLLPTRAGVVFAVPVAIAVAALTSAGYAVAALGLLGVAYVAVVAYYLRLPEAQFPGTQLQPVISHRTTAISRVTFLGAVYASLTLLQGLAGLPAWNWYLLYWVVPLFSTFALFMVMRQWVQHGNADRGRYTNTRVFLVHPLVQYAIFPWGMDFHLPHHLYASVPHYRLRELHDILQADPEYRDKGVIVEGYLGDDDPVTGRPTAMSVIGPKHAPKSPEAAFVDDDAIAEADVKDATAIAREAAASLGRG